MFICNPYTANARIDVITEVMTVQLQLKLTLKSLILPQTERFPSPLINMESWRYPTLSDLVLLHRQNITQRLTSRMHKKEQPFC